MIILGTGKVPRMTIKILFVLHLELVKMLINSRLLINRRLQHVAPLKGADSGAEM